MIPLSLTEGLSWSWSYEKAARLKWAVVVTNIRAFFIVLVCFILYFSAKLYMLLHIGVCT